MLKSDIQNLPSSDELPCSDETPVDNEEQNFIPNFLLFLLEYIWGNRQDWFFGVDMAVYHTTGENPKVPVIPDGFLSVNVERRKGGKSRDSYVVWEENNVPILAIEVVSKTPGGEYDSKEKIYAQLGVLYYVVYNPRQFGRGDPRKLEVYKLINGKYSWQVQEPVWMPEIGLGIGRGIRNYGGVRREVLYWFDEEGKRYIGTEEAEQKIRAQLSETRQELEIARQRTELERQQAELARRQAELERQLREQEQQQRAFAQQQAEQERQQAESAQQQAEQERQRAESAQQQAEQERQRAEQLERELERYRQQFGQLHDRNATNHDD
ncbi:Uma2 family endonuclease [Oscillatoria sp. FACHB-1406]|uniref:Uma2 family endonuclease n=1 Tax=Oscillatoria sp. FACHB-1406 TaxID=2692846 RepID=UPI0016828728|nr:Uma2 family endonuclease [Oscillatoria sp. FACHB-1406]MBD2580229.1 Uma2 family endonuclease [Oscillatoria sp. FACHB-1406]